MPNNGATRASGWRSSATATTTRKRYGTGARSAPPAMRCSTSSTSRRQSAQEDRYQGRCRAGPAGHGRPNGLATPALVDLNGDSMVDFAYAGDLFGNMWKFKFPMAIPPTGTSPTIPADTRAALRRTGFSRPAPADHLASGSRPRSERRRHGGAVRHRQVHRGQRQGRANIVANQRTQTFYGIIDPNLGSHRPVGRPRPDTHAAADPGREHVYVHQSRNDPVSTADDTTYTRRANYKPESGGRQHARLVHGSSLGTPGLPPPAGFKGEMQVTDSILRNGRVIFTTLIPDPDPCNAGGTSWLMEMDALTGSHLQLPPFDVNRDGKFDNNDIVTMTLPDGRPHRADQRSAIGGRHHAQARHPRGREGRVQIHSGYVRQHPDDGRKSGRQCARPAVVAADQIGNRFRRPPLGEGAGNAKETS